MGNEPLAEVVQADMVAYFEHITARIGRLVRSLSDEELWTNPVRLRQQHRPDRRPPHGEPEPLHRVEGRRDGVLCVTGPPSSLIRPDPTTDVLLCDFEDTIGMVVRTLRSQGEAGLTTPVADCGEPVKDRFGLFLVCTAHVSNHVGQIIYLVQALGHPLDEKVW